MKGKGEERNGGEVGGKGRGRPSDFLTWINFLAMPLVIYQ